MSISIRITINDGLYLKDPQDSVLGRKIIKNSILLFNKLGFETFTFKKLAAEIESTEASIYRYFENKHLLLIYLVSWYWQWVGYLIEINTLNITDPKQKLRIIINSLVLASKENPSVDFVNESILNEVIISESSKIFFTKDVDSENEKGFFLFYKELAKDIAMVILEINPNFKYPHSYASNLIEMSLQQTHFAKHLPKLTDIKNINDPIFEIEDMLLFFAEKLLETKL